MKELTEQQKKIISKRLKDRGANKPCPRCGEEKFFLLNYYFHNFVQEDPNITEPGGRQVPTAVLICGNCGYISQHALGTLDLLKKDSK